MDYSTINTKKAPAAIGPYSQGVKIGNTVYTSGQLPINMATGKLESDICKATEASIQNCKQILKQAGSSLNCVVKTQIFLRDMNDFAAMNEVYSKYFTQPYPARSCVQVAMLPKNAVVEIEMVAAANA
jgi:2-iminobutanoate/2-iminopropanoate deaminase